MKKSQIACLLGFQIISFCSLSQQQIEYKADRIKVVKKYKGGAQRLLGNVVFIQGEMTMNCDSAYFLDNNTVEAYSNIFIKKGDSLTISGHTALYDGNTKLGRIEGDVVCTESDMVLTTDTLYFDSKNSIASYLKGGVINSKDNHLVSQHGFYFSKLKRISFRYDVRLTNPQYVITADTLSYFTASKTAVFEGPTNIKGEKDNLYCESGWYNTRTEISHLTKNAVIYSNKKILHADSVHYYKKTETGEAYSHVSIIDNYEKSIIYGDYSVTNQKKGKTIITGHAWIEKFSVTDTLVASADTIIAYQKKIEVKGDTLSKKKKINSDSIPGRDSSVIKAFHHVRLFKRDVQGVADTLIYSGYDSLITLLYLPIVWNKQNQISGKKVWIYMNNGQIDKINIPENTFICEKIDSIHFNQIKGRELWAWFSKDTLRRIDIVGNAQTVYYPKNDKNNKLKGASCSESSSIRLLTDKGKVDKMTLVKKTKMKMTPLQDVQPKQIELKGFSWQIEKKPLSREDVILRGGH